MNVAEATQSRDILPAPGSEPFQGAPEDLRAWLKSRTELSFVYSRSMGGLIQTGRAAVTGLDSEYLELRAAGTTMIIVVRGARYSIEPQLFFSPTFSSARQIPGVSVSLENFDWLFLTPAQEKDILAHGHVLPNA